MKNWFFPLTLLATLTACSTSNESKQLADDSYEKYAQVPKFVTLNTGGLILPEQDKTYQLPTTTNISKSTKLDIRPPSKPMPIIGNSVAQFDGERSSIVYPAAKKAVYNLQQVARLLTEKNIKFTTQGNSIQSDWAPTGRSDDIGDTQIRYQIDEVGNQEANALVVSVLQMKRNEIIFTPTVQDKARYTSDRLNQLIGELNTAYRTQQQQLSGGAQNVAIQSSLITDNNGHIALGLNAGFNQAWDKLGQVLPVLGFKIEEETPGRGYRVLDYKPLNKKEWLRFGVDQPDLDKGEYRMQLTTFGGNQSAVILANEDNETLAGAQAQAMYQALQALLAK